MRTHSRFATTISRRSPLLAAALTLAIALPLADSAAGGVLDGNCVVGPRPAATLLYPYFEVELDNPSGLTTLLAVSNTLTGIPVMARVTLWTEWAIPSVSFNLFLPSGDVQTLNLRDLFATGSAPATGPGANLFPGCNSTLGGLVISPAVLVAAHTGQKVLGACMSGGSAGPGVATGFVTVDVAGRCPTPNGGGGESPADGASYFSGGTRVALEDNVLWGDWFLVTPESEFASGHEAVHLQADADAFAAGDHTFYGTYVGHTGVDGRRPLPSRYGTRFFNGGPFAGGGRLIVWRDPRDPAAAPVACGAANSCSDSACRPAWYQPGEQAITVRNEAAVATPIPTPAIFDIATQRVDVGDLPIGIPFGWLDLDLDQADGTSAQAWVGTELSAVTNGNYSVGFAATAFNDLCAVTP